MRKIVALFALTCLTLIASPALAAELNGGLTIAAPEVGAVAPADVLAIPDSCFLTIVKKCCEEAGETLVKKCMIDGKSWFCLAGSVTNPVITTTKTSKLGFLVETTTGQKTCSYKAPVCGSYVGSCGVKNKLTTNTCTVKVASGALCETPSLATFN